MCVCVQMNHATGGIIVEGVCNEQLGKEKCVDQTNKQTNKNQIYLYLNK